MRACMHVCTSLLSHGMLYDTCVVLRCNLCQYTVFIWGFKYNFTNYSFIRKQTLELKQEALECHPSGKVFLFNNQGMFLLNL